MSLLKQDITKKGQINKFLTEFEISNNKKYEVEAISKSAIYAKKADKYLLELYYLVA